MKRCRHVVICLLGALAAPGAFAQPAAAPVKLSLAEMEDFLLKAKILERKDLSVGVTNSQRAVLELNGIRHDAHVQTIDVAKPSFQTNRGTEMNFRDTWKFNCAGYELDKILELGMIPPSVERKVAGKSAAVTWWIDDVVMDELQRTKKKVEPPDLDAWNKQMYVVRVFDQLIYNTDRNLGNLLITKDWKIWMIDHTRAFRMMKTIPTPKNLVQCDRKLLAKLRELNKETVKARMGKFLSGMEIDGLLARRDQIVKFFESEIQAKGENEVLYDLPH